MVAPIDKEAMASGFKETFNKLWSVIGAGCEIAPTIKTVFFIGSGSGEHAMLRTKEWIEQRSTNLQCFSLFSSKFPNAANHPRLDKDALVVIISKSGKTDSCEVAQLVSQKAGHTVIFTQYDTNPIASAAEGNRVFSVGDTPETLVALSILMNAFLGGVLSAKDKWSGLGRLAASLRRLPDACASAAEQYEDSAKEEALRLKNIDNLYLVASGPHELNSSVWGPCIVTEALQKPTHPILGVEFFHGQHEIVAQMDMVVFLGMDDDREVMKRVEKFAKRFAKSLIVHDAGHLDLNGIDETLRPLLAPFVMQAKLKRVTAHLSHELGRSLATRDFDDMRIIR